MDLISNQYQMNCDTALILAAGRGERLRPITDSIPKPLIQIGEHRLIEYHLFNLANSGVKTVYINRAHLREQFDNLLSSTKFADIKLVYLDEPDGALETAGAIINAFNKISADKLLVVNGDIWCNFNFENIIHLPDNDNDNAHLVLVANPEHNSNGDFSIRNNRLVELNGGSSYTFSGIGIYRRRLFAGQQIEFKKLAPVLHQQIALERISASIHDGDWIDVGTLERLELLRTKLAAKSS